MRYYTTNTQLPPYLPYARFLLDYPLSETARLIYSLILSRIRMSQSNGWLDQHQRVYCRYTIQELMKDSGKSKTTVVNALADLEACGLLTRKRCGAGYANNLYLRLPDSGTSECQKDVPQITGKRATNKYTNYKKKYIPDYEYTGDSL